MAGYGYNPYGGYGQPPMYAQQAYMPQMQTQMPQMPQQPQQPTVSVRLVTSRDEATTAQIPFDSTINLFVNLGAGEIYIKQFNPQTGGAVFRCFAEAAKTKEEQKPQEYVTEDRFCALEQRVSELAETMTARRTRGVRTDE